jgi:hypothetical protein
MESLCPIHLPQVELDVLTNYSDIIADTDNEYPAVVPHQHV